MNGEIIAKEYGVPIVNKPRFSAASQGYSAAAPVHTQQTGTIPTQNTQSLRPVMTGHTGTIPQIRPSVAQTEIKIPGFLSRNGGNKQDN